MPPAAISRSSTYFPKICGNIPNHERSALRAALLGALFVLACGPEEAELTEVALATHDLTACPIPNPLDDFTLSLVALGPFRHTDLDSASLKLEAEGARLTFSPETRGLDGLATNTLETFVGHTERRTEAGIDLLLWPSERACTLPDPETSRYPGAAAGQGLGFSSALGVLFVAGEDTVNLGRAQSALRFDANTGVVEIQPAAQPMPTHRAFASVTAFGDGFLVAGGENPTTGNNFEDRERWDSAHTYSLELLGFAPETITLQWDRTRHAALALADGSTLLAGGLAEGGPVLQFEAIYPTSTASSTIGLASLMVGRLEPTLLRLDDGRLLVGGGYLPIGTTPVGTVEWFSADATERLADYTLAARPNRVFAALPGGGALTVASCGNCSPSGLEASFLSADDEPVEVEVKLPDSFDCPTPVRPLLVPGSDGAPWLIAVSDANTPACLFRFTLWPAVDTPRGADDPDGPWPISEASPRFEGPSKIRLDPPPDPRLQPVSLGPDTFVWVTEGAGLAGARLGIRGSLSREGGVLGEPARPLHLAPDRVVPVDAAEPVTHLYTPKGSEEPWVLRLSPTSPPLSVWVTDTSYEDVTVTLKLIREGASGEPLGAPALRFGDTLLGGVGACPWPALPEPDADDTTTISAVRRETTVTLRAGSASTTCEVASGALPIGLRAPGGVDCADDPACSSVLETLDVARD